MFTTSGVGKIGKAFWGAYSVSKFGVEGLCQILSEEFDNDSSIRFNCINPGAVRTKMRKAAYPLENPENLLEPEEIMEKYLWLMTEDSKILQVKALTANDQDPKLWKTAKLVSFLEKAALAYQQGSPIINDDIYDHVYLAELKRREPNHPYLNKIDIEQEVGSLRLKHPEPMLSLEKSYSIEETKKWVTRILKVANKNNIDESVIKVIATAKLDGLAAMHRDDGLLATRGDGIHGNDITSPFDKGVIDVGKGISGVGELVMVTEYFETNLKSLGYSHPRNICVGVVNSDELNRDFKQALNDRVVRFVPYSTLERWEGSFTELFDPVSYTHQTLQTILLV